MFLHLGLLSFAAVTRCLQRGLADESFILATGAETRESTSSTSMRRLKPKIQQHANAIVSRVS